MDSFSLFDWTFSRSCFVCLTAFLQFFSCVFSHPEWNNCPLVCVTCEPTDGKTKQTNQVIKEKVFWKRHFLTRLIITYLFSARHLKKKKKQKKTKFFFFERWKRSISDVRWDVSTGSGWFRDRHIRNWINAPRNFWPKSERKWWLCPIRRRLIAKCRKSVGWNWNWANADCASYRPLLPFLPLRLALLRRRRLPHRPHSPECGCKRTARATKDSNRTATLRSNRTTIPAEAAAESTVAVRTLKKRMKSFATTRNRWRWTSMPEAIHPIPIENRPMSFWLFLSVAPCRTSYRVNIRPHWDAMWSYWHCAQQMTAPWISWPWNAAPKNRPAFWRCSAKKSRLVVRRQRRVAIIQRRLLLPSRHAQWRPMTQEGRRAKNRATSNNNSNRQLWAVMFQLPPRQRPCLSSRGRTGTGTRERWMPSWWIRNIRQRWTLASVSKLRILSANWSVNIPNGVWSSDALTTDWPTCKSRNNKSHRQLS